MLRDVAPHISITTFEDKAKDSIVAYTVQTGFGAKYRQAKMHNFTRKIKQFNCTLNERSTLSFTGILLS